MEKTGLNIDNVSDLTSDSSTIKYFPDEYFEENAIEEIIKTFPEEIIHKKINGKYNYEHVIFDNDDEKIKFINGKKN